MATGETGFDDVTFDLISLQYHSLKAGHDYGSARARRCHELLEHVRQTSKAGPAVR